MVVTINIGAILGALGALAGGIGAASVIWLKFLRPASRPLRELLAWLAVFREDWEGTPSRPGVPGRDGMMVRMSTIEGEFKPNGGGSLRDRVDMIERRQMAHESAHSAATAAVATQLAVAEGGDRSNGGERQAA